MLFVPIGSYILSPYFSNYYVLTSLRYVVIEVNPNGPTLLDISWSLFLLVPMSFYPFILIFRIHIYTS